ncbi:MAG: F0F1 ATP synthase subunit gamma [Desulfomonilia bacterium]
MQTLESLKKRIKSTQELLSVVKTMKALAAVSIRQYQKAVESLSEYTNAVEMGLQIVLQKQEETTTPSRPKPPARLGAIVFGSDQGLCGQFNVQVANFAAEELEKLGVKNENLFIMTVGERAKDYIEGAGLKVDELLSVPSSTAGITPMVQEIIMVLDEWHFREKVEHVYLFYNKYLSGASFSPQSLRLLPVDETWLKDVRSRKWESRTIPMYTLNWDILFASLIREYLFISLFQAFAESLASENASRLASMQNAEKNIEERLEEIFASFHRQRQMIITEELLDIVAGYEVLQVKKKKEPELVQPTGA